LFFILSIGFFFFINILAEKMAARQSEYELMMSELDRTRARVIALERERVKNFFWFSILFFFGFYFFFFDVFFFVLLH
jgi:hypothetical protein